MKRMILAVAFLCGTMPGSGWCSPCTDALQALAGASAQLTAAQNTYQGLQNNFSTAAAAVVADSNTLYNDSIVIYALQEDASDVNNAMNSLDLCSPTYIEDSISLYNELLDINAELAAAQADFDSDYSNALGDAATAAAASDALDNSTLPDVIAGWQDTVASLTLAAQRACGGANCPCPCPCPCPE